MRFCHTAIISISPRRRGLFTCDACACVQRFITDEKNLSEHERLLQSQRDYEHASKAKWLGGTIKPSNCSEAKETVRTKATLTSRDDAMLVCDLDEMVGRGQSAKRLLLEQTRASRGQMLHMKFPPATRCGCLPPAALDQA